MSARLAKHLRASLALLATACGGPAAGPIPPPRSAAEPGPATPAVPRDEASLRRACRSGDAASCDDLVAVVVTRDDAPKFEVARALALAFLNGGDGDRAFPKRPDLSVRLYEHACVEEEMTSCSDLGHLVATGEGTPQDLPWSVALFERACDGGSHHGCANLSFAYGEGRGVAKDHLRAFAAASRACLHGNGVGCNNVGATLLDSPTDPDPERALRYFAMACDRGVARGCYNMGRAHDGSEHWPRDAAAAADAYQRACEKGFAPGCRHLGIKLRLGHGRARDVLRAAELFHGSCDEGLARSCIDIWEMLWFGEELKQNQPAALAFLKEGCELEMLDACSLVADLYGDGQGIATDPAEADRFAARTFALATTQCRRDGDPEACRFLALAKLQGTSGVPKDEARGLEELKTQCTSGSAGACNSLGYVYALGRHGVPADGARAMELFRQACSAGLDRACDSVGDAYKNGWGTPVNRDGAFEFYTRACEMGIRGSCVRAEKMTPP